MKSTCRPMDHISRRAFLKGTLLTAGGAALGNWGGLINSQTIAAEAAKQGKRCILLWMSGGASQMETFDLKPGRPHGGPFRPIQTNVSGMQICEYLPNVAKHADKMAIIRSMCTSDPEHAGGTYLMHTGYKKEARVKHPEIGAMCAKYLGDPNADLPSFVQVDMGGGESTPYSGAGFLGPAYQPFRIANGGGLPENTTPYVNAEADQRRGQLLRALEEDFAGSRTTPEVEAQRLAQEKSIRLLKSRGVFDIKQEWEKYKDLYGDTKFGMNCLAARRLIEAGVTFVEVAQHNYDSHDDNFEWHKALLPPLDKGWAGLMQDMSDRGLLKDTLIIWMGEVGRTPNVNNRAGRDHFVRAWSTVLCGGGIKTGQVYGESDADCRTVKTNPVSEGDFFATVYTVLGINPRVKHFVGSRPIWATPETANVVKEIVG